MKVGKLLQDPKYSEKFVLQKLLCALLNCTREYLWTDVDRELDNEMVQKISLAYDDYAIKKKPLEYVLGHVDFFGKEFFVNEATLIPRPETEYMITAVKEFVDGTLKMEDGKGMEGVLLDVGTGCGVLGISVLLQNADTFREVFFSDITPESLVVAKKNYDTHIDGSRYDARFIQADLCAYLENYSDIIAGKDVILVANLPYIPEKTHDEQNPERVKNREPRVAFVGGDDGLDYYRQMFNQLHLLVENGTLNIENLMMFLEMMTWQVDILRQEFGDRIEFEEVKTFHFNIRIVKAWLK
ncbi:MAG: peptide chain release factor N(5)-glutamine methyltransferase [candidate division SR1 bacterium]|nr:peptide chain release factor N(5)-glutamine methyltransferase [candidate division SR1 bacterium]